MATTALLAGYGLLALPSTILLDQGRSRRLAIGGVALPAVGASVALAAVWMNNPPATLGKAVGTATAFALASMQASALLAGRPEREPTSVRWLYGFSPHRGHRCRDVHRLALGANRAGELRPAARGPHRARSSARRAPTDPCPCPSARHPLPITRRRRARRDRGTGGRGPRSGHSGLEGDPHARTGRPPGPRSRGRRASLPEDRRASMATSGSIRP